MRLLSAQALLAILPLVSAHGRITNITTATGLTYAGFDPATALTNTTQPPLAAWSAANLGNIFVPPSSFNTSAVSCHFSSAPGALHINVTAGSTLTLQWNEWPVSHVGPVLTYLAPCNGSCATADAGSLRWSKIDEMGWVNSTGWAEMGLGGTWATDVLISNGFSWEVRVPQMLAQGEYVLRHEILALHVAAQRDGAQAYPQCVNLRVGGAGSGRLGAGILGSHLYGMEDKGILVDVSGKIGGYQIPGPKLDGLAGPVRQRSQKRRTAMRVKQRQLKRV
ncbi:lytic polysaccharide monooxygenase [Dothidotthia symphoricarpi CBS 119687]|uniref:Lytic polysaccharide monooxygenase n=1 Tax=Dothidotthia symphoricarpi CBS 119687 TaxID=1392245 RepID=A0A6A6A3A0_9PLEO|nr:lytic polysaccharide monooxygenase [Dothidotthia symphoricarpi CBS 119687]KAF2125633.1 lytic polysaccharide monooxygenase [Dothidotthia symphoricarpi CBS 119687]